MEKRTCAKCKTEFQPDFANQKNCVRCKEYNLNRKQESRERERQDSLANSIPTYKEYTLPETQAKALEKYADEIVKLVQSELNVKAPWILEPIAECLFGFEKNYLQKVQEGMLIGGHFPDAMASTAVEYVHKIPNLLESPTFKLLYEKFLQAVLKWDGKYQYRYSSPELMADVRAELAGNYVLRIPAPVPAAPTPAIPEVSQMQPGDEEIECTALTNGRAQTIQQVYGASAEALRYLNGA
jgi:hypothetical protein